MPPKPKPIHYPRGVAKPNPRATALSGRSARVDASHGPRSELTGALQVANSDAVAWANECYLEDVATEGSTTRGRYTRVLEKTMAHFGCAKSTAERALRDAELMRAADFESRRAAMGSAVAEQLQRIADREEERDPRAAIMALKVMVDVAGLALTEGDAGTGADDGPLLDLRNLLQVLPPRGMAALDVLLEEMAALEKAGHLLPIGAAAEDEVPLVIEAEGTEGGN